MELNPGIMLFAIFKKRPSEKNKPGDFEAFFNGCDQTVPPILLAIQLYVAAADELDSYGSADIERRRDQETVSFGVREIQQEFQKE